GTAVSLGRPKLKNIAERFAVYALLPEQPQDVGQTVRVQRLKFQRWRHSVQIGAALLLLVGAGVWLSRRGYFSTPAPRPSPEMAQPSVPPALPLPDKPSIVVLPFVNMSEDPKQEYFSDGITEDLTSALSKISSLFVIARNSAFTYKGKAVKV